MAWGTKETETTGTEATGYESDELARVSEAESGLNSEIAAAIRQTLDIALSSGAEAADIVLEEGQSQSLQAQHGKISENKISATRIMGIRVQKNGRLGLSYSESLREAERRSMVEMALRNAEFAKLDPSQGIHSKAEGPLLPDCSAQWLSEPEVSLEQKEELARMLESEPLLRDKRVRVVPYCGFGESHSGHYVANSNGVFCYERGHGYGCYTYVLMEQDGRKADYGQQSEALKFSALDWQDCVDTALREAAVLLDAKPAGGNYDVIFAPDVFADLLGCFDGMFSGFGAKAKTNPMRDKLGEIIAAPGLQLIDMPRYREALNRQYFDAEGQIPKDLPLIENGVLRNFYHNTETARYFDTVSNARAVRSAKGGLRTGGNCLLVLPGTDSVREGKFVEIMELHGLHAGCDAISGDFSLSCTGKLYDGETMLQGVRDATLAGNFYQMLGQLGGIGAQLKANSSQTVFTPDLRFCGLNLAC